jgi:tetratricopeptide (TPR) repeat protein
MFFSSRKTKNLILAAICCISLPVHSDILKQAINTDLATQKASIQAQEKIDRISDDTRKMLDAYRSATRQTETLRTYNQHIKQLIDSQLVEKQSLQKQLYDIENTQREIVPLILNMLDSLENFVKLDIPFLTEERQQRIKQLQQMMLRADITNAEKYRRILEAYQIENDYGNTIEAYRAFLPIDEANSAVDFLRLGRVALYYQRLDGSETGFWNRVEKRWETLPSDYTLAIRNGLRMARKEAAPDLLIVPIPAAEAAK